MTSSDAPQILVYGFGAVGILYAYILENAGAKVTAVARSGYASMSEHGIDISSGKFGEEKSWKPSRSEFQNNHHVVSQPSETPNAEFDLAFFCGITQVVSNVQDAADGTEYRYILCTFKCLPDFAPTTSLLDPIMQNSDSTKSPTLVLMQNGLGIEKPIKEAYPQSPLISAAIWIGANTKKSEDGKTVLEHGSLERLDLGLYEGDGPKNDNNMPFLASESDKEAFNNFVKLLESGGGAVKVPQDMQAARWDKTIWNAVFSVFCTLSRKPIAGLLNPDTVDSVLLQVRKAMWEVLHVARSLGFDENALPSERVEACIQLTLKAYGGGNQSTFKPSMLIDIESGRPMELYPILGSVIEHAHAHNIDIPVLSFCHSLLLPCQATLVNKQ